MDFSPKLYRAKYIILLIATSLFSEQINIRWDWNNQGLYCNLIQIAEWIYCVKQDDSYGLYVHTDNPHSPYFNSEAIFPHLFKIDENDPQITFKPNEHFVIHTTGRELPCSSSWIPFKAFATDGMKNFEPYHAAYGTPRLFEDPDFSILRERFHAIIQRYMTPAPSLQNRIDALVEEMGEKEKIGVHVRFLDYYTGCPQSNFLENIEADIDQIMATKDRDNTVIYLATLLDPLLERISLKYNVVAIDCPRCQNLRTDWHEIPNQTPLDRARDAIVDAWALSSCDEFWCASSNMSVFVCCINPKLKTRLLPYLAPYNGK